MDDNCSLGAVFVKSASANRLVRHAGLLWREFRGSEYADSAPSVSPDLRANLIDRSIAPDPGPGLALLAWRSSSGPPIGSSLTAAS